MDRVFSRETGLAVPRLWNPTMAAYLSLFLPMAFGAYLHAANWRTLGDDKRARANMLWVWGWVVLVGVGIAGSFVRVPVVVSIIVPVASMVLHLGLLVVWRFTLGAEQIRHVKNQLAGEYIRRGWGRPVAVAVGVGVALYSLVAVVGRMTEAPTADEVAAEITPLILDEWHKDPALRDATIQSVTMTRRTGKEYTGVVDATIAGKRERVGVRVVYGRYTMQWELHPLRE